MSDWSQPVSRKTGWNWFVYYNWTEVNQLSMVWSGCLKIRLQLQPVVLDEGPKTGLNRTFKHYAPVAGPIRISRHTWETRCPQPYKCWSDDHDAYEGPTDNELVPGRWVHPWVYWSSNWQSENSSFDQTIYQYNLLGQFGGPHWKWVDHTQVHAQGRLWSLASMTWTSWKTGVWEIRIEYMEFSKINWSP